MRLDQIIHLLFMQGFSSFCAELLDCVAIELKGITVHLPWFSNFIVFSWSNWGRAIEVSQNLMTLDTIKLPNISVTKELQRQ